MADIMQDVLNLNYSPSFDIQGMQEADINLSLSPSVAASATVYGTVTDGTNPLPNATVKLFDSLGVPYRHVMTDVAGAYSFDNVPAGTYTVGETKSRNCARVAVAESDAARPGSSSAAARNTSSVSRQKSPMPAVVTTCRLLDMKRTASTARRKGRIRLMDRCLLAYMAILLAQSASSRN